MRPGVKEGREVENVWLLSYPIKGVGAEGGAGLLHHLHRKIRDATQQGRKRMSFSAR